MAEPLPSETCADFDDASGVKQARGDGLKPGVRLGGRYLLEGRIGEGGMATVFAARHLELGQRVAIKVMKAEISADEDARGRFAREARAAASLRSENAVRVYDVGRTDNDIPFLVMEYLEGNDLGTVLDQRGPLPILDVLGYGIDVCDALADAHALGLVHRDVKPQNLFLACSVGAAPKVKVLDFGLAKSFVTSAVPVTHVTAAHVMVGSPFYMSPEQVEGLDLDPRTDVWSLAATLHALLTGRPPFNGANLPLLLASILQERPRPISELRPDVPRALEVLLLACMSRDRMHRPMTIAHVQVELEEIREAVLRGSVLSRPSTPEAMAMTVATPYPIVYSERRVTTVPPAPRSRSNVLPWVIVFALFAMLAAMALVLRERMAEAPIEPSAARSVSSPVVVSAPPQPKAPAIARSADETSPPVISSASATPRKKKVAPYVPRRAPTASPNLEDPYAHP
jgi:eukaryotic-like serine/threonine-protein kinase